MSLYTFAYWTTLVLFISAIVSLIVANMIGWGGGE